MNLLTFPQPTLADALRVTGKTILLGLWQEAKRIHESGGAS